MMKRILTFNGGFELDQVRMQVLSFVEQNHLSLKLGRCQIKF